MIQVLLASAIFTGLIMVLAVIVLIARTVLREKGSARLIVNGERVIMAELGNKLLGALDDGGVHLPTSCGGAGTCGLCRVQVSSTGPGDAVWPIERATLSQSEIVAGFRLACQTVVRGDLDLTISPEFLSVKTWQCTVRKTHMLAPLIREIILDLPEREHHTFPAGCYVLLTAPPFSLSFVDIDIASEYDANWQRMGLRSLAVTNDTQLVRAYSLVNRPGDTDRLTLNIRLALPPVAHPDAPPGVVSSYLFGLKPGDKVQASGPYGNFFVQDTNCEMIFIGGGVGMAPLFSHVYDQLESVKTARTISYWYGARGLADLYYADEMDNLARDYENFSWHVVLSDPAPDEAWAGERGFVHEAVYDNYLSSHPDPQNCEYYLCGPPLMIEAVQTILDKLNVPREKIFFDDFGD